MNFIGIRHVRIATFSRSLDPFRSCLTVVYRIGKSSVLGLSQFTYREHR
jgi:hypothetical protein